MTAEKLIEWRKEHGLNLSEAANILGVGDGYLGAVEIGGCELEPQTFLQMERATLLLMYERRRGLKNDQYDGLLTDPVFGKLAARIKEVLDAK